MSVIDSDLDRLEREAFRTSNDTGFEELGRAVMMLAFAWFPLAFTLLDHASSRERSDQFALVVVLLPPILAFIGIDKLKRRDIAQRLGTFKPSSARRRRQRLAVVIPMIVTAAALTIAFLEFGDTSRFSGVRFAVTAVTFGVCGLIVARLTEQPRQRYLGWLTGIGFGFWLGFGPGGLAALGMAAVGLVYLIIGVVVVRRFHRRHPVLPTAGPDVRV